MGAVADSSAGSYVTAATILYMNRSRVPQSSKAMVAVERPHQSWPLSNLDKVQYEAQALSRGLTGRAGTTATP